MRTVKDMRAIVFRLDYETDSGHAERKARMLRDLNRLRRRTYLAIAYVSLCVLALGAYVLLPEVGPQSPRAMYVSFFATMAVSSLIVLSALRSRR